MTDQSAAPDAAILEALSRWRTATAIYLGTHGDNEGSPVWAARVEEADQIEREIAEIPAEGVEGLAIKAYLVLRDLLGEEFGNPLAIDLSSAPVFDTTLLQLLLDDLLRYSPSLNAIVGSPTAGGVA